MELTEEDLNRIPYSEWPIGDNLRLPNGWNAHTMHLKHAFGLRQEQKWPIMGLHARKVGNVTVWVISRSVARGLSSAKRSHRVWCRCPYCSWSGSAGRLHQHQKSRACQYERMLKENPPKPV